MINGGVGIIHPKIQAATFRLTFIRKMLGCDHEDYFNECARDNVLHILIANRAILSTHFYLQLTKTIQKQGVHFMRTTPEFLTNIPITNCTFFTNSTFPYISKSSLT